jgi:hypothetical protein
MIQNPHRQDVLNRETNGDMENTTDLEQRRRDLWEGLHRAIKEENQEEGKRLITEWEKKLPGDLKKSWTESFTLIDEAQERIQAGVKQPNLAKCVLATMDELKDIGYWSGNDLPPKNWSSYNVRKT